MIFPCTLFLGGCFLCQNQTYYVLGAVDGFISMQENQVHACIINCLIWNCFDEKQHVRSTVLQFLSNKMTIVGVIPIIASIAALIYERKYMQNKTIDACAFKNHHKVLCFMVVIRFFVLIWFWYVISFVMFGTRCLFPFFSGNQNVIKSWLQWPEKEF